MRAAWSLVRGIFSTRPFDFFWAGPLMFMATAGLLMNRACASLVSALRVSIPVADVPSARACRRSSSPASLRHHAAPAIPTPPSIAGGPGHSLWRAGLWPWRSAAASGPLAVGRLSFAHTQEPPCGLSPREATNFHASSTPLPLVGGRRTCRPRHARRARFRAAISRWSISACAAPRVLRVAPGARTSLTIPSLRSARCKFMAIRGHTARRSCGAFN